MTLGDLPIETTEFLLKNIGKIGLYLQGIGVIVLIWLGFQIANLRINYKMKKKIEKIENDILKVKKALKIKK